jgi:hypothetical protein
MDHGTHDITRQCSAQQMSEWHRHRISQMVTLAGRRVFPKRLGKTMGHYGMAAFYTDIVVLQAKFWRLARFPGGIHNGLKRK